MAAPLRFHLDEHVSPAVATGLRLRGIDVTTTVEAGLLGVAGFLRNLDSLTRYEYFDDSVAEVRPRRADECEFRRNSPTWEAPPCPADGLGGAYPGDC